MSIKRVSDLKKRSLSPDSRDNFQQVLDDTYTGSTELANSLMEISWNKNPSNDGNGGGSGDDNEFESQAITIHALSAGITDSLFNRDVYLKGRKQICGDVEITGNFLLNRGVDLEAMKPQVELYGWDTIISSKHNTMITSDNDTIISSGHYTVIKGQTSVIIEIDNPEEEHTVIELKDKEQLTLSSGNQLCIFADSDLNLVYGKYGDPETEGSLTIWHRYENTLKPMLRFEGDKVIARGSWIFPESYPLNGQKTIDGYINHAYYS